MCSKDDAKRLRSRENFKTIQFFLVKYDASFSSCLKLGRFCSLIIITLPETNITSDIGQGT